MGKQLELLCQVVPTMTRVGILANPGNGEVHRHSVEAVKEAARPLGMVVGPVEMVSTPEAIEEAFASYRRNKIGGLIVLADGLFYNERKRVANFALRDRIPSIFLPVQYAEAGGLMSFGPNLASIFRCAGYYVSKILEGAMPSQLPVELPTRYTLAINLRTAKELGLMIPQAVLLRADVTL
jgi:putative tryptophan/tyrosine transport system substrate-binding protein